MSTVVSVVMSPFADNAPAPPVEPPATWTLLTFARREFERNLVDSPTRNPLAGQVTKGLLTSESIDPVSTGNVSAPTSGLSDLTSTVQRNATAADDLWTGQPSMVHELFVGVFRVLGAVGGVFGAQSSLSFLGSPDYLGALFTSDSPPSFTTLGLTAQRSEFEGMPVWTLQAPGSTSDKSVVAISGGGYVYQPSLFHWLDYTAMARETGATVVVPVYPLAPQGTAATVVPQIADLISSHIEQHGAENVSVYGDSAGGGLALAAVQELVRRGDQVPSHMVLISPALDLTLSDPASQTIDDPGLNYTEAQGWARLWAGDLDLTDPLASPLYGSLAGLPPTAVYSGSLDLLSPQVLRLRERALTENADMTFVLREGLVHDWAAVPLLLPEALEVRPDIYQQLGIGTQAEDPWTGEPSIVHELFVGAFRVVGAIGEIFGAQSAVSFAAPLLESDNPPWFTTLGLHVQHSEFDGMPVWTLQSPTSSSGKYLVGLHGGGYVIKPSLFHWLDYAAIARDTGATVVVPIYPLAPQGTAAAVVPQIADLIASQIDQHGAENVNVYGDSAGAGLGLAAVQELVRRGDQVPSHMVLISPELDVTLSDPASQTIDDPYLNASEVEAWGRLWAGDLDPADPRVSPLYGSLAGLPPTAVYSGSLDLLSPQVLRLRERALAEGVDMTFVLRKGLAHDWAINALLLPEAAAVRPDIYQQLGIVGSEAPLHRA